MAFKRSAVRSRLSPPRKTVETTGFQRFFFFSPFPHVEFVLNACGIDITRLLFLLHRLLLQSDSFCVFIPRLTVALLSGANITEYSGPRGPAVRPLRARIFSACHMFATSKQNLISISGVAQLVARVVWEQDTSSSTFIS